MYSAYAIVTVLTIAANAWAAGADFAKAKFVLGNAAALDLPLSWLPLLGALKAAGAAGLLLGIFGDRFIGIAAAFGLVLFFIGAIAAHVRARAFSKIVFPGIFLALASASLVLAIA
jgi:hypothetical protein